MELKQYDIDDRQWTIDNKAGEQDDESTQIRLLMEQATMADEKKMIDDYLGPQTCLVPNR